MTLSGWTTLRHRDFALICGARFAVTLALQIINVAIGWYIYDVTGSAFALAWLGAAGLAPALVLVLATGYAADRVDRRLILFASDLVLTFTALGLLWLVAGSGGTVWPIYLLVIAISAARAFHNPAGQAIIPTLVPEAQLGPAIAFAAGSVQAAQTLGPALGGVLYAVASWLPFAAAVLLYASSALAALAVKPRPVAHAKRPKVTLSSLLAGFQFACARPVVIGAISLDTVIVAFAGVVLLMPVFAKDVLGAGPIGLGLMRTAPAVGALGMGMWLASSGFVERNAGTRLFQATTAYGIATACFGLSSTLPVALICLVGVGASDMISMVIRHTMVQAETPDDLRGRVSSVNALFITASSELGQLRAGVVAGLLGVVPAAVIGGASAIALSWAWPRLFPALRDRDRLIDAGEVEEAKA